MDEPQKSGAGRNLLIIGLGLLGGSVALGARRKNLAERVFALTRPGRDHQEAVSLGLIDRQFTDLEEALAESDLIVMAAPVEKIKEQLQEVLTKGKPGALVMDVGSTKQEISACAEQIRGHAHFVPCHPMAGSHLTGWKNAKEDLFADACIYVTPSKSTDPKAQAEAVKFWKTLGGRIVITDPERHDWLTALLSHTPHMAAAALVRLVEKSGEDPHFLRPLAGPGFRDSTRIAMGSPEVWQEIAANNGANISNTLRNLIPIIEEFASVIESQNLDQLSEILGDAAKTRTLFNQEGGKP